VTFFRQYQELQNRPFYILGESYGGHYVPNTAKAIQDGNALLPIGSKDGINLRGFAVGNGYTDWFLDFNANVENGRFHALTSDEIFNQAQVACNGSYARCFWPRDGVDCPPSCQKAVDAATENAMDGSIDIYDIYEDVCLKKDGTMGERLPTQMTMLSKERNMQRSKVLSMQGHELNNAGRSRGVDGRNTRRLKTVISPVFDTCIDNYNSAYLNLPEVQAAIHVRPGTVPNNKWASCGNVQYHFNYESELPNYRRWLGLETHANTTVDSGTQLQILIYNGDADYILSHMGNQAWIRHGLNLSAIQSWRKWRGSDGQVAGYYEVFTKNFTFLTVKGAGHMVPKDRPRHALDMLKQFLAVAPYDSVGMNKVGPLCAA